MSKFSAFLFRSDPSSPKLPYICFLFSSSAPFSSRHTGGKRPFEDFLNHPKIRVSFPLPTIEPPKRNPKPQKQIASIHPKSGVSSHPLTDDPPKRNPKPKNLIDAALAILKHPIGLEGWRNDCRWARLYSLFLPYGGITPKQVSKILRNHINKPIRAKKFFDWASASKLLANGGHTLASYASIVHVLARCRYKKQAQCYLEDILGDTQPVDAPKSKKLKPVEILHSLLDTYVIFNSAPYVLDLLVQACLKFPCVDQIVLPMLPIMFDRTRYYLRITTCNLLIGTVVQQSGCRKAYPMYRKLFGLDDGEKVKAKIGVSPNLFTYNELLSGFHKDKAIGMLEEVWGELRERFEPNNYSYKIALSAFCDAGKMTEAEDLLIEMRRRRWAHDLVVYNILIGGFCRVGDVGKARSLFREMKESAIEPNSVTYQNLIYGYCKIQDLDSAMKHFKGMIKDGFMPRPSAIEAMIRKLCHNKRVSDASHVFGVAMTNPFYVPSANISKFLIDGYIEKGEMEEALKLREVMVKKGFYPCSESYAALINGYSQEGNNEVVKMLKNENKRRPAKNKQRIEPKLFLSFFEGDTSPLDKSVWSTTEKL